MVAFMNDPRETQVLAEESAETVLVLALKVTPCEDEDGDACFRVQYQLYEVPREDLPGGGIAAGDGAN